MLANGRISLAGLNDGNTGRFADALAAILGTNE
jgi:aspartate/tyrosine/aromatic aminotransferase